MVFFKGESSIGTVFRRRRLTSESSNSPDVERVFTSKEADKRSQTEKNIREQFIKTYGHGQRLECQSFAKFIQYFLRINDLMNDLDYQILLNTCGWVLQDAEDDIFKLLGGSYYKASRLAHLCIKTVHHNRFQFLDQLLVSPSLDSLSPLNMLLKTIILLLDPKFTWSCKIVSYLLENNVYSIFKEIILTGKGSMQHIDRKERAGIKSKRNDENESLMETILGLLISHNGSKPCVCPDRDRQWGFISILMIPFLWLTFPKLEKIYVSEGRGLCRLHLNKMVEYTGDYDILLSVDISDDLFIYVCLLGNIMEAVGVFSAGEASPYEMYTKLSKFLTAGAYDWRLPLVVFVPQYRDMVMTVDHPKLYKSEKQLLHEIKLLVDVLRKILCQILLSNSVASVESVGDTPLLDVHVQDIQRYASDMVGELRYWLLKAPFEYVIDPHVDPAKDHFLKELQNDDNSRAKDVLKEAPFLVDFQSRVHIFIEQISELRDIHHTYIRYQSSVSVEIRRDQIPFGAINQLIMLDEESLLQLSQVKFINEDGVDYGGLFTEFMDIFLPKAFDPHFGLFKETDDHRLYPNPDSGKKHSQHLQFFYVLGVTLGMAIREGILVNVPFATFFLNKITSPWRSDLNDLPSVDPVVHSNLMYIKKMNEVELAASELYFIIRDEQKDEELKPGGKDIKVDKGNVSEYIKLYANYRLNTQIKPQCFEFVRGFQQLIPINLTDMFTATQLQLLISGLDDKFDVDDLLANTDYSGYYYSDHYVITWFFEILREFSVENQRKVLKFVTGSSRGPLLGFKDLNPKFCIQSASEEAPHSFPTSSTCFKTLYLPPYTSKEEMETKLLTAVNLESRFDLP